jgi:hypothetical protein
VKCVVKFLECVEKFLECVEKLHPLLFDANFSLKEIRLFIYFIYFFILSFLDNDFNLIMVASTTETSFNKISFNQKNFHVLSFIYRLKLKQFENLNGIKNSFKLTKLKKN